MFRELVLEQWFQTFSELCTGGSLREGWGTPMLKGGQGMLVDGQGVLACMRGGMECAHGGAGCIRAHARRGRVHLWVAGHVCGWCVCV